LLGHVFYTFITDMSGDWPGACQQRGEHSGSSARLGVSMIPISMQWLYLLVGLTIRREAVEPEDEEGRLLAMLWR
jgi:hypothetical protein